MLIRRHLQLLWLFGSVFSVLLPVTADETVPQEAGGLSFNRDIRPLLSNHCYACHGPDEENREAGFRLDIAGEADWDEVVARITSTNPDELMPPPEANKPLASDHISTLQGWIEQGAIYEHHWAFVPPVKPEVPDGSHPVDYFIDRQLANEGLQRSPIAPAMLRLRRVCLDLVGLPPTNEQIARFATDPSQDQYEKIVDELLASPRYGERWARRWLDLARYADTNGYEKDRDRPSWPYRDWTIRAINADMPFDQFTLEQIAGDMLPAADSDAIVATGFHRNTMLNEEGGIDPLEFRFHAMTDRVATTGTTWLGLTTGCAQCHTHKYDPITHHDYYGMMAYLNNVDEPTYFIRTEQSLQQHQKRQADADAILTELPLDEAIRTWWNQERINHARYRTASPSSMQTESMSAGRPYLVDEGDGVILAGGDTTKHDVYRLDFAGRDHQITSVRLEALPDDRLPGSGPGLTYYEGRQGDFFLSEMKVATTAPVPIVTASHTYAKNAFGNQAVGAEMAIDGDLQTGWSVADRSAMRHVAVFKLQTAIPKGTAFQIEMHFGRHFASSLGKFRISFTDADTSPAATLVQEQSFETDEKLALARADVREAFLLQSEGLTELAARYVRLRQSKPGTPTLVMTERPAAHPRQTFLHHRGEYLQARQQVDPRLPDALRTPDTPLPSNRLGFARWLVSRKNPLTARVVVNRAWAAFFGTGIVATVGDFGMQGEPPTHPDLLDFLAVDWMDNGWSMKKLHRMIVTSQTYQQSSARPSSDQLGPEHPMSERWLSRFPRKRLEAEIIRDASLAAAGLLETKMFGPPVRPPQPDAARAANYSKSVWQPSEGVDRFRRSIYTYQQRTAPFAMFTTFDGTSGEACVAQRDVSNTPLQSLTLMNDPMFLEIAEAYGELMRNAEGDSKVQIQYGFRRLLTRSPSDEEVELLSNFIDRHHDWTALARVLLCLDEAITKN